jgi:cyclase
MRRIRVIPVLLINNKGLVKSVKFKNYRYVGDPINAVKIFNEKEVDEICILDISASRSKRFPDFEHISEIVSEAFMPLSYGGGISSLEHADKLFYAGVEKLTLNKSFHNSPQLLEQIAANYGSQSVSISIDVDKNWLGKTYAYTDNGKTKTEYTPLELAIKAEDRGAGEILLNSISRDGTYQGYDLDLIEKVTAKIKIPLVACGGASDLHDFAMAIEAGASAVAAGSMFVFQRPNQAVLISYPSAKEIESSIYTLRK